MYIKLTRLDNFNTPIWINAAFVVTVEPRKGGGSVVVPIGDGLDYDVRETPEQVLAMLADAPAPTVVPVPAPKSLTPTPDDVSPEPEQRALPSKTEEPSAELPAEKPKRTTRTRKTKAADGEAAPKRTRKTKAKAADEMEASSPAEAEPVAEAKPTEPEPPPPVAEAKPQAAFSDEQVERLKKMSPRSLSKLQNTLKAQFRVSDADAVIAMLGERGVIALEHNHVVWQ